MIDATLLLSGTTVFSPWFPRQADMLRVTAECIAREGASIMIKLFTKNQDEIGNGTNVDESTSISLSAVGRSTAEWQTVANVEGVEQLLRFQYLVTSVGEAPNDWILFRLLPAVWFDAVKA